MKNVRIGLLAGIVLIMCVSAVVTFSSKPVINAVDTTCTFMGVIDSAGIYKDVRFTATALLHFVQDSVKGGGVDSIVAGAGLDGGTIKVGGTISMPNVGTAGTYGNANVIPGITTDAQGRVIAVTLYTTPTPAISAGSAGQMQYSGGGGNFAASPYFLYFPVNNLQLGFITGQSLFINATGTDSLTRLQHYYWQDSSRVMHAIFNFTASSDTLYDALQLHALAGHGNGVAALDAFGNVTWMTSPFGTAGADLLSTGSTVYLDTSAGHGATKTDLKSYMKVVTGNVQSATTYSLQASDYGNAVIFTSNSAITLTVPSGLGSTFYCTVQQGGNGNVTVSAGSGVTILNPHSYTKTYGKGSNITIMFTNTTDTYDAQGDMQ